MWDVIAAGPFVAVAPFHMKKIADGLNRLTRSAWKTLMSTISKA